jgi:hypothetical protein
MGSFTRTAVSKPLKVHLVKLTIPVNGLAADPNCTAVAFLLVELGG